MKRAHLEELLHERGRALDEPLLSSERAQALQAELRAEAQREAGRTRRTRLVLLSVLTAAAAAILLLTRPWEPAPRTDYGELRVELALLDPLGRPLDRTARSPDPATFVRPEQVVLELQPEADGFVTIAHYDPLGALWLPDDGAAHPLEAGELALLTIPLGELPTRPDVESIVGVLALNSTQEIPLEHLHAELPGRLATDFLTNPGPALDQLTSQVAHALGCSCEARTFTLAVP